MYSADKLAALNSRYLSEHVLNSSDVDMANKWVNLIASTRTRTSPVAGDTIEIYTKTGDYIPYGFIESACDGELSVCEKASTPRAHQNQSLRL